MPNVIATHAVGDMKTWLAGGPDRAAMFAGFCSSYRIYRLPDQAKVAIHWEDVDMAKFQAILTSPEAARDEAKHTVLQPIEVFMEIAGGT